MSSIKLTLSFKMPLIYTNSREPFFFPWPYINTYVQQISKKPVDEHGPYRQANIQGVH